MITSKNIKAFINYLHQKRTGNYAHEDLLNKWNSLNETDIQIQLQKLFSSWDLSAEQANVHIQNFLEFANPKASHHFKQEEVVPHATKKSSNVLLLVLGSLIGAIILGSILFFVFNQKNKVEQTAVEKIAEPMLPQPASTINTNVKEEVELPSNTKTEPSKVESNEISDQKNIVENAAEPKDKSSLNTEITERDKINYDNLNSFYQSELNQNLDEILYHFSNNIRQYWFIKYPTAEQLQKEYERSWKRTSNRAYRNLKFSKIGYNKYRVTGILDYFSIKDNMTTSNQMNDDFEFDENGKIIYTNKVE